MQDIQTSLIIVFLKGLLALERYLLTETAEALQKQKQPSKNKLGPAWNPLAYHLGAFLPVLLSRSDCIYQ